MPDIFIYIVKEKIIKAVSNLNFKLEWQMGAAAKTFF